MLHRAGGVERRRDHAEAAEHPLGAEALLQGVEVTEAEVRDALSAKLIDARRALMGES